MKVVMYSNYINHHQIPLAQAFNNIRGVDYIFVATTPFDNQRAAMGYKDVNKQYDYVIRTYESIEEEAKAHQLAKTADIVIVGSAPDAYMAERLKTGKVTFHTSERFFRKEITLRTFPRFFGSAMKHIRPYQKMPLYYLCSSAYTAKDVNTFASFKDRCFKWAYFTEIKQFNIQELINKKNENTKTKILWVGRFLRLKHPDAAIRTVYNLKANGYNFHMDIIGGGQLEDELKAMVRELNIEEEVRFLGYIPPESVRLYMENANVFLFTSDFNEGWGAVLNEAMSSGCAVVASHACGASPFLIHDGENGFLYQDGHEDQLYRKTEQLLIDKAKRQQFGMKAYKDMCEMWNPDVAAMRLLKLNEAIKDGNAATLYADGPCSAAPILENGWYRDDICT